LIVIDNLAVPQMFPAALIRALDCFMIMNIDALNLAEQQLFLQVKRVTGLMEEKHEQLQRSGVFGEYGKIYEAYVELMESENEGLEALKRAIFLMWYEQAEPACFTGIFGLSEDASRKVFETLEHRIETGKLDLELKWMLPFYNDIAEWVFSKYADLPCLEEFLATANSELWQEVELKAEDFVNRGKMGDYWRSIIESKAAHSSWGAI